MTVTDPAGRELLDRIAGHITAHPRSQQTLIGPSEIGHPCDRWVAYKVKGARANEPRGDLTGPKNPLQVASRKWRPTVGTAVHSWLEGAFGQRNNDEDPIRFLTERKVHVGNIPGPNGYAVWGSCDLYDIQNAMTVDWKVVGKATLDRVRRAGHPGAQYRIQGHAYGSGYLKLGLPVSRVSVMYLPNSGELEDSVFWSEKHDQSVTDAALDRIGQILAIVDSGLTHETLEALTTVEHYCDSCPFFRPSAKDFSVGCPGAEGRRGRFDPLADLIL